MVPESVIIRMKINLPIAFRLAEVYRRIRGPTMIELNSTLRFHFHDQQQRALLRTLLKDRLDPYYEHLNI